MRAAAMTASGFRLTRVAPLLGRTLLDEDERPGAPPVLVIGYEAWQRQFNGDPRVLGTTVRLDETVHAIVGVMPEGFGVPHQTSVTGCRSVCGTPRPIRAPIPRFMCSDGSRDGFSEADARAELAIVGEQMAAAFPRTHAQPAAADPRPTRTPSSVSRGRRSSSPSDPSRSALACCW